MVYLGTQIGKSSVFAVFEFVLSLLGLQPGDMSSSKLVVFKGFVCLRLDLISWIAASTKSADSLALRCAVGAGGGGVLLSSGLTKTKYILSTK